MTPSRTLGSMLALALGVTTFLNAQSELVREGNRSYHDRKYLDAEVSYRKALEADKDFPPGSFNLGDALYRQQRFPEAAEQYQVAAPKLTDPVQRAYALHNMGNALLKSQKLPESIAAYKEALKLNPGDMETKYNLEYAKTLLKQRQEQKQEKPDQSKENQANQEQQKDPRKEAQGSQNQAEQRKQEKQQSQLKQQQVSREDAEMILEALRNEEQNVQRKLQKRAPARVRVEKDW